MRQRVVIGVVLAAWAAALACARPAASAVDGTGTCRPGSTAKVCLKVGVVCKTANRAAYRRAGFTCTHGRLRRIAAPAPKPAPPPTTTPAPVTPAAPLAGHFAGTTSQGHSMSFDVQPDRKNLTKILGGAIDQTCTPAHAWTFDGFDAGAFDYAMGAVNIWHLPANAGSRGKTSAGVEWSTKIQMSATFSADGSKVTDGTYAIQTTFTENGVSYTCDTSVGWTAAHT